MNIIRTNIKGLFVITMCLSLVTACSSKESDTFDASGQNTSQAQEETREITEDDIPGTRYDKTDIEVTNDIQINKLDIGSNIVVDKIEMGKSSINKEVLETLSEFDAVDTADGTMLTLPEDILFDYDSSELRSKSKEAIEKLAQVADEIDDKITIIGHTDSKGSDEYNEELSKERAQAVVTALVDAGVKESRLQAEGKGASEPVAKNTQSDGSDNPDGRQKNRRVEVIFHGFN